MSLLEFKKRVLFLGKVKEQNIEHYNFLYSCINDAGFLRLCNSLGYKYE
jgi:hypothetical protein